MAHWLWWILLLLEIARSKKVMERNNLIWTHTFVVFVID